MKREQLRMRRPVAVLLLLALVGGLGINYIAGKLRAPREKLESQIVVENLLTPFMRTRAKTISFVGTPGTPVLIGIKPDGRRGFTCAAILPTNITVRFRHRAVCTVKNLGTNFADLRMSLHGHDPHGDFIPPYFGHSHTIRARPGRYEDEYDLSLVRPIDWPEALPPGMDREQAAQRNFTNDFFQARLDAHLVTHAREPQDPAALVGIIASLRRLQRTNDSLFYYEKLMATECPNPYWLSGAAYAYVQWGGTNLDLAYSAAVRAQEMHPNQHPSHYNAFRNVTGYVLVHRGDYEQALTYLNGGDPETLYVKGLAHYKLGQKEPAEKCFIAVEEARAKWLRNFPGYPPPKEYLEAQKYLERLTARPRVKE